MKYVVWFWNNTIQTSETKCLLLAVAWAGAIALIPGAPLDIPPIDMGPAGTFDASPATLSVYVLGRLAFKAMNKGEIPFWPDAPDRIPLTPEVP